MAYYTRTNSIQFIAIGGTIGVGFFSNSSLILGVAGPGGALLAFALVGVVAIAAMEGLCEMIVLWPIPNPMVEFVRAFVDPDLAIVVGIAYWYAYAVTFSALILEVANLADFWEVSSDWRAIIFVAVPITLLAINFLNVRVYGTIETIGGIIKLVLVAGIFLLMICINAGGLFIVDLRKYYKLIILCTAGPGKEIGSMNFDDGIQYNPKVAKSRFAAVCIAIPLATFAYLGVELVAMTAFEAKDSENLEFPAKNITWVVTVIYTFTTLVFVLNVKWNNKDLPQFFNQGLVGLTDGPASLTPTDPAGTLRGSRSNSAPVIATINAGVSYLPGFLTACFIYSTLSTANTGLYVASRDLFGLTREIRTERDSRWFIRAIARLSTVESRTRSPWWALLVSVLVLCWLPFQRMNSSQNKQQLQEILVNVGSVTCVLVWSSQCLAFICYYRALKKHEHMLTGHYEKYKRSSKASHFAFFQPAVAWLGLVSTLLIVVFFNSASMWRGGTIGTRFVTAYLGPIIFIIMGLALKLRHNSNDRQWHVHLDTWADFSDVILDLNDLKANRANSSNAEDDTQTRTGSVATMNAARLTIHGSRGESNNEDSGPGDFVPIRVYSNGDFGSETQTTSMQMVQPVPTVKEEEGAVA